MKSLFARWTVGITILCVGGLLTGNDLAAEPTRQEIIAHLAKLYGQDKAEQLYEETRVQESVDSFIRRLNFRDVLSLTGPMEEDALREALIKDSGATKENAMPIGTSHAQADQWDHLGSPQAREYITTAAQDYTTEDRKALRADLLKMFLEIPPQVRISFQKKSVTVFGASASVDMAYSFRALEFDTPESLRLTARPATSLTLRLRKSGDRWLVEDLKGIARQMATVVASR